MRLHAGKRATARAPAHQMRTRANRLTVCTVCTVCTATPNPIAHHGLLEAYDSRHCRLATPWVARLACGDDRPSAAAGLRLAAIARALAARRRGSPTPAANPISIVFCECDGCLAVAVPMSYSCRCSMRVRGAIAAVICHSSTRAEELVLIPPRLAMYGTSSCALGESGCKRERLWASSANSA
jgi:hypothetical protein